MAEKSTPWIRLLLEERDLDWAREAIEKGPMTLYPLDCLVQVRIASKNPLDSLEAASVKHWLQDGMIRAVVWVEFCKDLLSAASSLAGGAPAASAELEGSAMELTFLATHDAVSISLVDIEDRSYLLGAVRPQAFFEGVLSGFYASEQVLWSLSPRMKGIDAFAELDQLAANLRANAGRH